MAELVAHGVVVQRGGAAVLQGVDVAVSAGELVAVMGVTGSGKSSLALALAGLVPLAAGRVDGSAAGSVGVVLQRPEATFLRDRVLDEVSLAAMARGASAHDAAQRSRGLLELLGLPGDVADRDPLALSGGEQRRVAIAAVLAGDPGVLVLDEPGAGLDPAARRELHRALHSLREAGRTIVLVTHDPAEAAELATRLVVLESGRVAWDGDVAPMLGDPHRAAAVGLGVAPEVAALHAAAAARGVSVAPVARPGAAIDALAGLLSSAHVVTQSTSLRDAPPRSVQSDPVPSGSVVLPARIDARIRVLACALAVAAALVAGTLLAAAACVVAAALVVGAARIERARVRLAVRPLVALAVLLVGLQLLVDPGASEPVARGLDLELPASPAILRTLQASAIVLATLALSAATAPVDLAAALRWLLAPLRLLRIPVNAAAFVVATALGLVPVFADELERLRTAQSARGLRPRTGGPLTRLRADAQLLVPLVVGAFRRAHQLADALVLRGFSPDAPPHSWRPRVRPASDMALLAAGIALLAVARFA